MRIYHINYVYIYIYIVYLYKIQNSNDDIRKNIYGRLLYLLIATRTSAIYLLCACISRFSLCFLEAKVSRANNHQHTRIKPSVNTIVQILLEKTCSICCQQYSFAAMHAAMQSGISNTFHTQAFGSVKARDKRLDEH